MADIRVPKTTTLVFGETDSATVVEFEWIPNPNTFEVSAWKTDFGLLLYKFTCIFEGKEYVTCVEVDTVNVLHWSAKELKDLIAHSLWLDMQKDLAIDSLNAREILHHNINVFLDQCMKNTGFQTVETQEAKIARKSKSLPGYRTEVIMPCDCIVKKMSLGEAIIHLNDLHEEWTREKIADWLDELHDAGLVNIEFEPWEEE